MSNANENPLNVQEGGTHYKEMKIQPVEFVHANNIGFCEATAIKYLCRWRKKGGLQDLRKAIHFIQVLIELETRRQEPAAMVKEGPYCSYCDLNLADFGRPGPLPIFVCSNCAAEKDIDTSDWNLMWSL